MSPKNSKPYFKSIFKNVENASNETEIRTCFVAPLIEFLGYKGKDEEKKSEDGKGKIDFSMPGNKKLPPIFIEVKGRDVKIMESAKGYDIVLSKGKEIDQIEQYIKENPGKYRFGIITNGKSISIYRNYYGKACPSFARNRDYRNYNVQSI